MSALEAITARLPELTAIRRDIHAHPELGLNEHRTAELVATKLESWGIEVHRGVGKTGVVGVLRNGNGLGRVGLRCDMDALPIVEASGRPYASQTHGLMHACGHDGHTAMLLGAAQYLAATKNFSGTVHFIFQPGEEGAGGALAMLEDGLLERFPCDQLFGLHNRPDMPIGEYAMCIGPAMAGGAFFDITITGRGGHGASPQFTVDPVQVACHLGTALQSIVSRNVAPNDTAVLSVTMIKSGDAYNVIPQSSVLSGTVRTLRSETMARMEERMRTLADGIAAGFGATAAVDFRILFAPLFNSPEPSKEIIAAAADLVGMDKVDSTLGPHTASEDFSFMLERVPGAQIRVGNGPSAALHNPRYDFNDESIPYGAAIYARVVERILA